MIVRMSTSDFLFAHASTYGNRRIWSEDIYTYRHLFFVQIREILYVGIRALQTRSVDNTSTNLKFELLFFSQPALQY